MGAGWKMLMQYNEEGKSFLSRIVISDETWLHYWTSEGKSTSMAKKTADKTAPWKFKEKVITVKVLATIFWDHKGVLYSNIAQKVLLRLLHHIFTHWFACKRPLRINVPVSWSEKSFSCMTMPLLTQQSSLKVCSTNRNGMFSDIRYTHQT